MKIVPQVSLGFLALCLVCSAAGKLHGVPAPKEKFIFLDLEAKANHKRTDSFVTGRFAGNDLAELPKGEQKLGGVKFWIGAKVIQLFGTHGPKWPTQVEGIAVGNKFAKLHLLHGVGFTSPENTVIGSFIVHYEDKTTATIAIVYGKDVRDWMSVSDNQTKVTRGTLAWQGLNAHVRKSTGNIRLYLRTWKNPHPKKKVVSLDFTSAKTVSAPFCVAITLETK
jgi:hypothetical protein